MPPSSPPLPSHPTPDNPSAEDGSDSHQAAAAEELGWSREQQGPGGNEALAGDADLPHDLLDARDGRAWPSGHHWRTR